MQGGGTAGDERFFRVDIGAGGQQDGEAVGASIVRGVVQVGGALVVFHFGANSIGGDEGGLNGGMRAFEGEVEGRFAVVVFFVRQRAAVQQEGDAGFVSVYDGFVQVSANGGAEWAGSALGAAVLQEGLHGALVGEDGPVQRGGVVFGGGVDACAVRQQEGGDVLMSVSGGPVEGCFAELSASVDVRRGLSGEEDGDLRQVSVCGGGSQVGALGVAASQAYSAQVDEQSADFGVVFDGQVQRGSARGVFGVEFGAVFDEITDDVQMSVFGGAVQGGGVVDFGVDVASVFQQFDDQGEISIGGGAVQVGAFDFRGGDAAADSAVFDEEVAGVFAPVLSAFEEAVQRGFSVGVSGVDLGAVLQQQCHRGGGALPECGLVQGGVSGVVFGVDGCVVFQQDGDDFHMPLRGGQMQGGVSVGVLLVGVFAGGQQDGDAVEESFVGGVQQSAGTSGGFALQANGAVLQEEGAGLGVFVVHHQVQWGASLVVGLVYEGADLQQDGNQGDVFGEDGVVQVGAVWALGGGANAVRFGEDGADFEMSGVRGEVHRSLSVVVFDVGFGAVAEEDGGGFGVAHGGGQVQGGGAQDVCDIHGGAVLQEEFDDVRMSVCGGDEKGGV